MINLHFLCMCKDFLVDTQDISNGQRIPAEGEIIIHAVNLLTTSQRNI